MSSHHFVRDEQEPALIVNKLTIRNSEMLGQLLEWSPFVIVPESQLDLYTSLGFKLDLVISADPTIPVTQDSVDVLSLTSFSDVLSYLESKNHRAVNVLTDQEGIKKLIGHPIPTILDLVFITETDRQVYCRESVYSKWVTKGTRFGIMPLQKDTQISLAGEAEIHLSQEMSFHTQEDGILKIHIINPPVLISESIVI